MTRSLSAGALLAALTLAAPALAQEERFELGQRLRQFEAAWEATPDATARKRALPHLHRATVAFFSNRAAAASQALDQARFAVTSGLQVPAAEWAASLGMWPEARLLDTATEQLHGTIRSVYAVPSEPRGDFDVWLSRGELRTAGRVELKKQLPFDFTVPTPQALGEGDFSLVLKIAAPPGNGRGVLELASPEPITISRVDRLKERLADLDKRVISLPAVPPTVEQLTARSLHRLLTDLADKKVMETNYPAARLLREAEEAVAAAAKGERYYAGRAGQFWLTLPTAAGTVPVRLQAPADVARAGPRPLVVALHGAGGSENFFFDAYGRGMVAKLAAERGWIVMAPRSPGFFRGPPVAELVDAVARLYPVDPKRVYLVGHSMGAAQAVEAAGADPGRFAGVAALAGGGQVRASEALKAVPFFVGTGTEDFARNSARALAADLTRAGVATVVTRAYPDVEHLMTVPQALPAVFELFDKWRRP